MPGLAFTSGTTYLVTDDRIGGTHLLRTFERHLPTDPHGQPRPGERLPLDDLLRHAQFLSDLPDLVLEQVAEGFDDAVEVDPVGQATDVVVGLDRRSRLRASLDPVPVEDALLSVPRV